MPSNIIPVGLNNQNFEEQNPYQDLYEKTFGKVLAFLSYSSRTVKEITDRIDKYLYKKDLAKEVKDKITKQILEDLGNMKLLDDTAYATSYVEGVLRSSKTISKKKMSNFLYTKGIPQEIANTVLETYASGTENMEEDAIKKLADKKFRGIKETNPRKIKQKLATYLLGKGFPPQKVFKIIETYTAR